MLPELIHAHHSRYLEDLPFWLELAAQTGGPVLELGCGTGRVLLPLVQAGHYAIGLDHNLSMLKFLKARIEPQMQPAPGLIASDISGFNLAAHFPLVILPCNTFSTLDVGHRMACLGCIRRHLRSGGIFAVSVPNPQLLMGSPARSAAEFEDEFIHPQTGNPVQVNSSWRRTKRTFIVTWIYDHLLPDGTVERLMVETAHQVIPVDTYLEDMRSAGLIVTEVYGDFDRSEYSADSPHLIILATG
jgi:SAM-dependent methyltransferase